MSSGICWSAVSDERLAAASSSAPDFQPCRRMITYCCMKRASSRWSDGDHSLPLRGPLVMGSAAYLSLDDPPAGGLGHRVRARGDVELAQDRRHVMGHGLLA